MLSVRDVLERAIERFARAGVDSPRLNAELLLARALGVSRGDLKGAGERELTPGQLCEFEAMQARRASREPVDYILGEREFYGRMFAVRPGVLVPRPETETMIDLLKKELPAPAGLAADIGCGSGALAVTLALEFPGLRVLATDISATAVAVTRENAARLGARLFVARMDGLSAAAGPFDLIVSNPPYIDPADAEGLQPEVLEHEPHEALFGGKGGTAIAARLLRQVAGVLKPEGLCLFEHGFNQGEALRKLATAAGLKDVRTLPDMAGLDRVLWARG
ncbi:MAG: peptide chain release factor N(5)-glutamine methyltransferase [Planctomycetes bacterium]|nr:peptide chain release factor N(5)-glutamine methyltransferase [Planctomycetota bacterium]MCW8135794.1 peptide chain release factor N(5)-glutamine methyltransferase [Planctomycetota bacterium]